MIFYDFDFGPRCLITSNDAVKDDIHIGVRDNLAEVQNTNTGYYCIIPNVFLIEYA